MSHHRSSPGKAGSPWNHRSPPAGVGMGVLSGTDVQNCCAGVVRGRCHWYSHCLQTSWLKIDKGKHSSYSLLYSQNLDNKTVNQVSKIIDQKCMYNTDRVPSLCYSSSSLYNRILAPYRHISPFVFGVQHSRKRKVYKQKTSTDTCTYILLSLSFNSHVLSTNMIQCRL